MKEMPIVLIDDDLEDLEILADGLTSLGLPNPVTTFSNPHDALASLLRPDANAFFILCDVNMPRMSGFELCEKLHKDETFRNKHIPFIFISTSIRKEDVQSAHCNPIHGYFVKGTSMNEVKLMLRNIIDYWSCSLRP